MDQTDELVEVATDELNELRRIRPPDELQPRYDRYLEARGRALELLLSGKTFSGKEAAEWGIAARSFPKDEVLAAALELAHDIADNTAPASVSIIKRLVYEGLEHGDRSKSMVDETKLTWWAGTQPDAMEGVMSWLEKRPPKWSGSKAPDLPDELAP